MANTARPVSEIKSDMMRTDLNFGISLNLLFYVSPIEFFIGSAIYRFNLYIKIVTASAVAHYFIPKKSLILAVRFRCAVDLLRILLATSERSC